MSSSLNWLLSLHADDSTLLVADTSVQAVEDALFLNMEKVSAWLVDNKLSLHLEKTESILFSSKKKLKM